MVAETDYSGQNFTKKILEGKKINWKKINWKKKKCDVENSKCCRNG